MFSRTLFIRHTVERKYKQETCSSGIILIQFHFPFQASGNDGTDVQSESCALFEFIQLAEPVENAICLVCRNPPQLLLQPVPVQLTKPEAQAVLENLPLLQSLGFDVSEFSDWQLVLRQVPADLSPDDACAALEAFAEDLLTGKRPSESDLRDNLLHTMACKAAIKAGWHTEPKEREALVREVLSRDDIKYCPHGRPVCIELTRKELEKQFKRT